MNLGGTEIHTTMWQIGCGVKGCNERGGFSLGMVTMVMLVVRHMWARQVDSRYRYVKCSIVAVTKRHILCGIRVRRRSCCRGYRSLACCNDRISFGRTSTCQMEGWGEAERE